MVTDDADLAATGLLATAEERGQVKLQRIDLTNGQVVGAEVGPAPSLGLMG